MYFPHPLIGQLSEVAQPCLDKPILYNTMFLHYMHWFWFSAGCLNRKACLYKVRKTGHITSIGSILCVYIITAYCLVAKVFVLTFEPLIIIII